MANPIRVATCLLTMLLLMLCGSALAQQAEVTYSDSFQSYGSPKNPPGWVDTAIGSSKPEAAGLFKTWPDPLQGNKGTNIVFGSKSASGRPEGNNPRMGHFSTLTTKSFNANGRFEYRGRFIRTAADAHIGFTFLSSYPEKDSYYLVGLWTNPGTTNLTMQLHSFGAGTITGTTNSGFTPAANVWYRFAIQVDDVAGATKIRARFWADTATEPTTWTIDAQDAAATRLKTGRIGVWGAVRGANYVDDLFAKSPVDHTAPVITFYENGVVLPPNATTPLNHDAKVDIVATDDLSGVATVTATRNGEPYVKLTPIPVEGLHVIRAIATDNVGNRSESETTVLVDKTPPVIALTESGTPLPLPLSRFKRIPSIDITATDQWTGAKYVATLDGQPYTSGTPIQQGSHTLIVEAEDGVKNQSRVQAQILVDLGGPTIEFIEKGVVLTSPAKFKYDPVVDLRLTDTYSPSDKITYTATLDTGASWLAKGALPTGWHKITVIATDESGNSTTATLDILIDLDAPVIVLSDGTTTLDPSKLAKYRTDVAIGIAISDATSKIVSSSSKLDGQNYESGTLITTEQKSHALVVRAEDEAGNVTEVTLAILLDKTPPVISFFTGAVRLDERELQKFLADVAIRFEAADAISNVEELTGTLTSGTTTVPFASDTTITAEGPHTLRVTAKDETGNVAEAALEILLDKTPPVIELFESDVLLDTVNETPFGRPARVRIKVTDNLPGESYAAKLDGTDYTSEAEIATDGHHVVTVRAVDRAGNVTNAQAKLLVDQLGPVITFYDGTTLLDNASELKFKVKPTIVVKIEDAFSTFESAATINGQPFTSGSVIEEGRYTIAVTATDARGHKTDAVLKLLVDVTAPVVVLKDKLSGEVLPPSGKIFNRNVDVDPVVTDTSATVKTMTVDGTTWSEETPIATEGERTVSFKAADELLWETTVVTKFVIDKTPPVISVFEGETPLLNGASFARNVVIKATYEDITASTLTATIDGQPYTLDSEYTVDGSHTLVVNGVDAAQNHSAPVTIRFHIDKNAPEVTLLESGVPFPDGETFTRDVVATVNVQSATETTRVATIDGQPYNLGDAYPHEGHHHIKVVVTNLANLSTTVEADFTIDKTPPTLQLFAKDNVPFTDGMSFKEDITPFTVADDNLAKPPKVTVTLNGQELSPGTVVSEEKNFHTISAVAEDKGGLKTTVGPFKFVLDKSGPAVTIKVDGKELKTGDKFNKAITPEITAEDITDLTWTITLNDRTYERGTLIEDDAYYTLSVKVKDALGNETVVDPIEFVVDKTPPVVKIVHKETKDLFEGKLYTRKVVPEVVITDLTPVKTTATLVNKDTNEESPWSSEQEISTDAHYTLKVTVTDDLDWVTVHPPIDFTIDQAAPVIVITERGEVLKTNTIFNRDAQPKITVTDTTNVTVDAKLNGVAFTSETLVTEEKDHTLTVKATDDAGFVTEAPPIVFVVDKTPPVVVVEEKGVVLQDNALLNHEAHIIVKPTDLTPFTIDAKVDGQPYVLGSAVTGDGPHTFDVTVTDSAGWKTVVPTIHFVIDTTRPVVTVTETKDGGPLESNDKFKETIAPFVHITDISTTTISAKLDGVAWTNETPIATECRHVLEVSVTDAAGWTTVVPPIAFLIDKSAPTVQLFESSVAFATGKKLNRPAEITITTEDCTDVTTAATLNDGTTDAPFTFPGTVATDGRYTLNVTVTDELQHATVVAPVAFIVDQTRPVVTITESGNPLVSGDAFNRNVKPEIAIVDLTNTTTVATLNGAAFTFGTEITEEGKYTLAVEVTDELGWTTVVPAIVFYVDKTPPVVTLKEGENDLVDGSWFNRDVVPRAVIVDTTETTTAATLNGQTYTMETPVTEEGEYTLVVSVTDKVGLKTDVPAVKFTIDKTPPAITFLFPAANAVLATPQIVVVGDSDDAVSVAVNDITTTIDPAEKKYATTGPVELLEGENTLTAFGVDRAGNNTTITQTVRLDTRAPELTVTAPAANACLDVNEVQVAGKVADAALASVKVSAGGTPVDAVISADKRSFTASLPVPNEGKIVIRIEAIDATGHTSSATVPVTIDRTKPAIEVTESGHPFTATLVNRVLALYVRAKDADPNATVAVTLDGQPYTNGTAIAAEKTYTLRATAKDCAGRESDELVLQFTIDRTPPQIVSINPANNATLNTKPLVTGALSEPASLVSEATGSAASVNGVNFTFDGQLGEGLNSYVLLATDAAGNQSRTPYALNVDTIAPSVEITENGVPFTANQLFNRAVTPLVTTNDPTATITATLNTNAFTPGAIVDADGSYTITAKARDAVGNESAPATATFRIDRSGPGVTITSPADNATINDATVAVQGTVSGEVVSVTVNGVPATLNGTTFSATVPLELGPNVLNAIAIDDANNSASDSVLVNRGQGSLTILLTAPPPNMLTNRPTTLVAGQVLNVPNTQKVTINGTDVPYDPAGAFRRLDFPLNEGENQITAAATSKTGEVSSVSTTVIADFTPPVLTVLANGTPLTEGARFATSPALTLDVTDNYPTGLTRKLTVDGEITNEGVTSLLDGGHALTATARDMAGNETRVDRVFFVGAGGTGGGCALSSFEPAQNAAVFSEFVRITGRSGGAANVLINGKAASVADGSFCGDATLVAGRNEVTIQCADAAGQPTTDPAVTLVLHRYVDPDVAITSPSNGAVLTAKTVTVTGTVGAGVTTGDVNGVPFTVPDNGAASNSFSVADVPVTPGLNVLIARARTLSARLAAASVHVKVLNAAPQIAITAPLTGTETGTQSIDVTGTYANVDPSTITVNGAAATTTPVSDTSGTFRAGLTIAAGVKTTITVTGRNFAGVSDTKTIDVTHVATAPFITITSPADNTYYPSTHDTPVRVTGTFGNEGGLQVQVNGTLATIEGNTFSADVTLPASSSGITPLIARVTAGDARSATDSVRVIRFNTALAVRDSYPAKDASNVDPGASIVVLFNNPLDRSTVSSALAIVDSRGTAVSGTTFVDRDAIAFAPSAPLTNGERYTVTVATSLKDVAGSSLAANHTFSFNLSATAPVTAPIVDDTVTTGCFSAATITGRVSTAGAKVRLDVDGVTMHTNASDTGAFKFTFTFSGQSGYHLVRVREVGADGTLSTERALCYRISCAIPQVIAATLDRAAKTMTIQFSKAMDATTLSASANGSIVIVPEGETALDGTVTLNAAGDVATVVLTTVPAKTVNLTVKKSAKDVSGTPMSADYTQSFPYDDDPNLGRGDGYVNGAVYDASNGRPLESAVVEISGVTTKTTNSRGRYSHPMSEGAYTITASAPGYTTVWRQVVVPSGAGVVPIDIRLTKRGNAVTANGSAQKVTHTPDAKVSKAITKRVDLDLTAASLPNGAKVRLTGVGGQSLAGLLPLGWSPLSSAEVVVEDAAGVTALPGAKLTFFINKDEVSAANQTLSVAQYDNVRDEWRVVVAAANVNADGTIVVDIPAAGNYAVVYPDKAPLAEPADPRAGLPLAAANNICATQPEQCKLTGKSFNLDPKAVLPSGVTTATLVTDGAKTYPSGTAVQAFIDEQLNLADGRVLYDPPFATDLLIYRNLNGSEGVADFHLSPSAQAVGVILRDGVDHIRVVDYPGRLDRGTLIGAEGGRVPGDDGITLDIPAGATTEPLHASVSSISENDLASFGTFAGFRIASGFNVTLTRATTPVSNDGTISYGPQLLTPSRATVSVPAAAIPSPGAQVVIAEVLPSTPYGTTARVVALTSAVTSLDIPDVKVFSTRPIVSTELPLDGIVHEGSYLVLVAEQPIAYAYGQVRVADAAASRVRVSSGIGSPMTNVLGVRDLTRVDGVFVVPVAAQPAAPFSLVPRAPSTGDGAIKVAGSSPAADTFVNAGILQLEAQPPKLQSVSPADGAVVNASGGFVVQAVFDVAIDAASIAGGIVLANSDTRAIIPGTIEMNGASTVRFNASKPLTAASNYTITVMPNIRGLNGAPFGRSAVSTFSTRAIPTNATINRDLIRITMPDENGKCVVTGEAGALPGGSMAVAIRRGRQFIESYTVNVGADGAFTMEIGHLHAKDRIALNDIIELQVLDSVSRAIIAMLRLTPFVRPDGRSFFATPDVEARFRSPEGIVVVVPAGAFDEMTEVRVVPATPSDFAKVPAFANELNYVTSIDLQFDGISNKPLELEVPIPAGTITEGRTFLLGRLGESVRGPRIEIDDLVNVSNGMFTTRDDAPTTGGARSPRSLTTAAGGQVKEYLLKVHGGAKYCFLDIRVPVGLGVGWVAIDGIAQQLDMFFSTLQSLYISNFYLTAKRGRVIAPMLTGTPFTVEGVAVDTGMTEFTSSYDALPPAEPGTFQPIPSPQPNPTGPFPVFAKPFNIDVVELPLADEELTPIPGFKIFLTGSSTPTGSGPATVTRTGAVPASFSVVNIDEGTTGTGSGNVRTVYGSKVGNRLLIASSADSVEPTREIQIVFNEAVEYGGDPANLKNWFKLEKDSPTPTSPSPNWQSVDGHVEFDIDSGDRRVIMMFAGELQRGATYRVVIDGSLQDQGGGAGPKSLVGGTMYLPFTIRKPVGDVLGAPITLSSGSVRDLALDGNLLFVSALEGGLQVYDVSNPASIASLTPHAYTIPFPAGSGQQWAIEIDHHGRVWTTAQNNMYGLVRSFRVEDFHAGGEVDPKATGIVSWRVGINVGLPLGTTWSTLSDRVEATPRRLQILTQDQKFLTRGGSDFITSFASNPLTATVSETGTSGEFTVYEITIPKSTPRFRTQRVTVENLTAGFRWSKDILVYAGQSSAKLENVLVRDGDHIRVSRNYSTYGAVSLFGFGVGLFDLNAIETNHWHANLPGPDFEQPGEQIMVTEAKVTTKCQDPHGPDGNPCAPPVMTYTADAAVVSGLDDAGNPLMNVLALESTKGIRSVMVQPINESRESTGPDMSPYGPLGAHTSFDDAITFTSRNVSPPVDHPRLATIRKAFKDKGRNLNGRFSTIARYEKPGECLDPATGAMVECWKVYALVSGYQFGILVVDASKPLNQDSLVDVIWVPAGAVAVRHIPGTHYATATDGNNRSLLIDLSDIDESDSVSPLTACPTPASPSCTQPLFKTAAKSLLAGPDPTDPYSFGSDDPRIVWKSDIPSDSTLAGSLAPVADPETGFLFKGDLTGNKFRVYSGIDPHVSVKVNLGTGYLDDVTSIVPLGVQPPLEYQEYFNSLAPCATSGPDTLVPTRCRENTSMGVFRVELALPGKMTDEVANPTIAIESERIPGAVTEQTPDSLPRAHLRQRKANGSTTERPITSSQLKLRPIIEASTPGAATLRYQKGYNRFVSPWIVAIADPRARKEYKFELNPGYGTVPGFGTKAEAGCFQCDLPRFLEDKTPDVDYLELYTAGRFLLIRPEFTSAGVSDYNGTDYDYLGLDQRLFARVNTTMADTVRPTNVLTAAQNPPVGAGQFEGTVYLHSGEVSTGALDLDAGGRAGWHVLFDRMYHSRTIGGTAFGMGWDSGIFKRLRLLPTGDVEYRDGSGEVWLFVKDGNDYISPKGYFLLLVRTTSGWTLVDQKRRVFYFDDYGRIVREGDEFYTADGKGNQIRYLYDADGRLSKIIDPNERPTSIFYFTAGDREGLVERLEDWHSAKRIVRYQYEQRRLIEVAQPEFRNVSGGTTTPKTRYAYTGGSGNDQDRLELATNLEAITLPNEFPSGPPRVTFGYGPSAGAPRDYVGREKAGTNETAKYEYVVSASPTATTTDVLGQVREYTFELPVYPPAGAPTSPAPPDLYRYAIDRAHVKTLTEKDIEIADIDFGVLPTSVSAASPMATTVGPRTYSFEYDDEGELELAVLEGISASGATYTDLGGLAGQVVQCAGVASGSSNPCAAGATAGAPATSATSSTSATSDAVRFEFAHNGGYLQSVAANGRTIATPEPHRGTPSLPVPNESHQATDTYDVATGLPTGTTTSGGSSSTSTANAKVEYKYPPTPPAEMYKRGLPIRAISGETDQMETHFSYPTEDKIVMVDADKVETTITLDQWRRPIEIVVQKPGETLRLEETFEYFPAGEIKEHRRRQDGVNGNFVKTTYAYDASGRLTSTTIDNVKIGSTDGDTKSSTVDFTRLQSERVVVTTSPTGSQTTTKFDRLGRVTSKVVTTDALNPSATIKSVFVYDKASNVVYASDTIGNAMASAYDAQGRLRRTLSPDGVITETDYDGWGNVTDVRFKRTATGPPFYVRHVEYTADGVVKSTTESGDGGNSRTTKHVWDAAGRTAGFSIRSNGAFDPGRVTMMVYDSAGRVQTTTFGAGEVDAVSSAIQTTTFQSYGTGSRAPSVMTSEALTGNVFNSSREFDTIGRPKNVSIGDLSWTDERDQAGNRIKSALPGRAPASRLFDAIGNVRNETLPDGRPQVFEYDRNGATTRFVDPSSEDTIVETDLIGRPRVVRFKDLTTQQIEYEGNRVRAVKDRQNRWQSFEYDTRGKLVAIWANQTPGFGEKLDALEYDDGSGRLTAWSNKDSRIEYSDFDFNGKPRVTRQIRYKDSTGLTTKQELDTYEQTHVWNGYGERTELLMPGDPTTEWSRKLAMEYDAAGNLARLLVDGVELVTGQYHNARRPKTRTVHLRSSACSGAGCAKKLERTYAYDDETGQLREMSAKVNGVEVAGSRVTYGNTLQVVEAQLLGVSGNTRSTRYSYDERSRLFGSVVAAEGDLMPPLPDNPGGGAPVGDAGPGVTQELLSPADFRGGQARTGVLDPAVRAALESRGIDPNRIDPPGNTASEVPGHKVESFQRGTISKTFDYEGALRSGDDHFLYQYDAKQRLIGVCEKPTSTSVPIRRIVYAYNGNDRIVGRTATYVLPPTVSDPQDTWPWNLEDRTEVLAADGLPAETTFVWDPVSDRLVSVFRTGSSRIIGDPHHDILKQFIHGDVAYDDPLEVTSVDPSQPVPAGSPAPLTRLYPIYDEVAGGTLQAIVNREGELVARTLTTDPFGAEQFELAGAAIDLVEISANKDGDGNLVSVTVSMSATEQLASSTVATGARLAVVTSAGTIVRAAAAAPSLAPDDAYTIRWTLDAAQWNALIDPEGAPAALSIAATSDLRAAVWAVDVPIVRAPSWAQAASAAVLSSDELPVEIREPLSALATFIATIPNNGQATTRPYAITTLNLVATAGSGNAADLLLASTFKAQPFVEPLTRLSYVRARWYDPVTGTWLTPDPMGYTDSSNLYAFAAGDPVNNGDPTGEVLPIVAYLGWVAVNTAVDVGIDYAFHAWLAPEGEEFDWKKSVVSNFAINAVTGGLGKLKHVKHLENLKYVQKLDNPIVRSAIDVGVTGTINMAVYQQSALQAFGSAALGRGLSEGLGRAGRHFVDAPYFKSGRWYQRGRRGSVAAPHRPTFLSNARTRILDGMNAAGRRLDDLGTTVRRYAHIEEHHLINQATLKGKNPHPLIQQADTLGVDIITARWNLKTMFHRGGHSAQYYDSVNSRLDAVYNDYLNDGANWTAQVMERRLREVADSIRSDLFWLRLKLY